MRKLALFLVAVIASSSAFAFDGKHNGDLHATTCPPLVCNQGTVKFDNGSVCDPVPGGGRRC